MSFTSLLRCELCKLKEACTKIFVNSDPAFVVPLIRKVSFKNSGPRSNSTKALRLSVVSIASCYAMFHSTCSIGSYMSEMKLDSCHC